jgi:diaminopimelate epimerase
VTTGRTVPVEAYHGAGNDFLVVAARDLPPADRTAFATVHCDRETGVGGERTGADGVLVGAAEPDGTEPLPVGMTLVQPDGSRAAMCGNGARCLADWAASRHGTGRLVLDTPAGERRAVVRASGVTVGMGRPSFEPGDVPIATDGPLLDRSVEGLSVTAVDAGVPHAVALVEDVAAVDLSAVAPPVRTAAVFPEGANVTLASVTPGADGTAALDQRTYERGVEGETLACGTGAVAAVAAARRLGRIDGPGPHRVSPPGGDLLVVVPDDGEATLTGPVTREFANDLAVPG